jgi:hypothetical protein
MPRCGAVLTIALLLACSNKQEAAQSFTEAMRTLCDAPDRCCLGETDDARKATTMARWIADRVTHPTAVAMLKSIGPEGRDAQIAIMREHVQRAGIDPAGCAILKPWSTGPSL